MEQLVKKYDRPAPRYTSYPPVPFWDKSQTFENWIDSLNFSLKDNGKIDLYIHIPFCKKLCYYCGCNRIISKNQLRGAEYVDFLIKEFDIYKKNLKNISIQTIHFGGGTPNFLLPEDLKRFLQHIKNYFSKEYFSGSIEIDPREFTFSHLEVLREFGFERVSMGIQDFDENVQQAINREQSYDLVKSWCEKMREMGIKSINFDLIYGLPKQSVKTIRKSIELVGILKPDLIAFYSYAHLPKMLPNQRLISEDDLLSGKDKRELYEEGKKYLSKLGYFEIGLDHFARVDSYLYKAFENKTLKRNFMGYTDRLASVLLGLGVSAISESKNAFFQNQKDLKDYKKTILEGIIEPQTSHLLNDIESELSGLIQSLMCQRTIKKSVLCKLPHFNDIQEFFKEMVVDGLLVEHDDCFSVTEVGSLFMRNIAMAMDFHLLDSNQKSRFSQSL